MSLSCECSTDHDRFYNNPDGYTKLATNRRKRCCSCKRLIDIDAICVQFPSYRFARDDIEINIYGEDGEIDIADSYMCETCGDLFFSLHELGFCVSLGPSMQSLVAEYNDNYV